MRSISLNIPQVARSLMVQRLSKIVRKLTDQGVGKLFAYKRYRNRWVTLTTHLRQTTRKLFDLFHSFELLALLE